MSEAAESLEQVQARHRKELKELQGRITNKKKNATKKTRKGVNDECAEWERVMKERHAEEVASARGASKGGSEPHDGGEEDEADTTADGLGEEEEDDVLENETQKLAISSNGKVAKEQGGSPLIPEQQQQAGGKKRNRQKERLARRAAEQEAAAIKAEEEASTMTDHRAKESAYMKKMFQTYKLVEKDIEPDGHCLFSAVADQLGQNGIPLGGGSGSGAQAEDEEDGREPGYKIVRRAAAGYMTEHEDDFAPFLGDGEDGEDANGGLAAYTARIRDTAEWGGQLELTALARRYGVEIKVVQDGRTETIGEEQGEGDKEKTRKTLWLAYYRHGYGLGEHYNSLRKAK